MVDSTAPMTVVVDALACFLQRFILLTSQWIIQLGFEQDLYQPYEFAHLYWYEA